MLPAIFLAISWATENSQSCVFASFKACASKLVRTPFFLKSGRVAQQYMPTDFPDINEVKVAAGVFYNICKNDSLVDLMKWYQNQDKITRFHLFLLPCLKHTQFG